jgi:hypothetical protein
MFKKRPIVLSVSLFILWTLSTYLLEGRLLTFLKPGAVVDRLIYILVANFIIGIGLSILILRHLVTKNLISVQQAGFQSIKHTSITVVIGLVLGISIYFLQNPPTTHPVVILNAFFQVLTVTIAEILVCWVVIGSVCESGFENLGKYPSIIIAILMSSILFGLYHYAHSPPFNTIGMVLFLSFIGLFTGLFFFISRNVYATIVFHNFFGIKGVLQALDNADKLSGFEVIQPPLLITALIAVTILIIMHILILRSKTERQK